MPSVFGETVEQFGCKLCTHSCLQRSEVSAHLERHHSVVSRDWTFMLSLMTPSKGRSPVDSRSKARGRVQRGRGKPAATRGMAKPGTRYDGEDDFDADWRPGQKKQPYRKVGQHFKCDACSRVFKREGQFDRHRCFAADDDLPLSSRGSMDEPDFKRAKAESFVSPQKTGNHMYRKIMDARQNCLEEGSYFYKMRKDLNSVWVDVESKTNKVEVQVSVEGEEEIIREMYQCRECSSVLPAKDEATCHVKGHLPTHHYCCKFCPDKWRFTNDFLGSVLKHVRSSHPGKADLSNCAKCGFVAARPAAMDEHMSKRHPPNAQYSCTDCSASFGLSILGLVNHVKIEHPVNGTYLESVVTEAKTIFRSDDIFECNLCEKVFFTKDHIEAHKESHQGGDIDVKDEDIAGIHKCCHCKYETLNVEELRMHISATHKHLYCKICDAHIFAGTCFSEAIINHILSAHDHRNDLETAVYLKDLTKEAHHYYGVSSSFKCRICPKVYFSRKAFADHMRVHDGGTVKDFKCEVCGVHKKTKAHLRKHVRSHRFMYFCPECNQFFTSNQALQEHLISTHSESEDLPVDAYQRSLIVSLFLPTTSIASSVPLTYVNNNVVIDYFKGKQSNLGGERFDFPKYVHNSLARSDGLEDIHENEGYDSPMETIPTATNGEDTAGQSTSQNTDESAQQGTTILVVTGEEGQQEQIAIELPPGTDGAQTLRELGLSVEGLNLPTAAGGQRSTSTGKLEMCLDSPFVQVMNTEFCLALAQSQFCWMTEETLAGLMQAYGEMECLFCGKFFHQPNRFAEHQNNHSKTQQFKCTSCDYFGHHFQLLRYHMDRAHGTENLQCNECEFASTSKLKFAQHMKKHAPKPDMKCSKCGFCCGSEQRMREHFSVEHPNFAVDEASLQIGGKRRSNVGSGLKLEPCKYCGKVFDVNALEKHLWLHEDVSPYKCDICDFSCRSKNLLAAHKQNHNVDMHSLLEKQHACRICHHSHRSEKILTSHIVSQHFDNNTCPQCGHVAANRGDFHCHLLIHSEGKSFACNICPTVLLQEFRMEEHFRTRHFGIRVQYTSFINENPISIQDIAQLAHEQKLSGSGPPNPPEIEPAAGAEHAAEEAADLQAGTAMIEGQAMTEPMMETSAVATGGDTGVTGQEEFTGEAKAVPTEEEINMALTMLIESGHHIPEGAEIVVDNGTILIDGVPAAIITTGEPEPDPDASAAAEGAIISTEAQHEEAMGVVESQDNIPTTSMEQHQQIDVKPTDGMTGVVPDQVETSIPVQDIQGEVAEFPSTEPPPQEMQTTTEAVIDTPVAALPQEIQMEATDGAESAVQIAVQEPEGTPADEQQVPLEGAEQDGAGYISLDQLDLASLNLPPGFYNIEIDEQGQTVISSTDTVGENTIQVVAQE